MDAIFILSSSHNITNYVHIHCPVGHRGDVNEMNSLELEESTEERYMYFML